MRIRLVGNSHAGARPPHLPPPLLLAGQHEGPGQTGKAFVHPQSLSFKVPFFSSPDDHLKLSAGRVISGSNSDEQNTNQLEKKTKHGSILWISLGRIYI